MPLNLRRPVADTVSVAPSGERRPSLGLLALPVLVLDVVCAFGVAAANHGTARTVLLAILGLCLVLTLVTLTVGPGLVRNATDVPADAYRPTGPIRSTPVLIMPDTPLPVPTPVAPAAHQAAAPLAPASELIVAAAQRHQTLVLRQRTSVAQLAGAEPDAAGAADRQAAIGQLEHLTERMRRHGDSLMVIAGVEPERPVRGPMALSEVIATAAAEIESSERVSWSLAVDQFVQPHLALPLAHLLAELLENATNYAFPAGGVQVFVQPSVDGVRLRIEDSGPGFSDADLERANQRLRDPDADVEEVGSLGFGLFVAGRLAREVPCSVEMTRAESGGVRVLVDLPRNVFGNAPEAARSAEYSHYDDHTDLPEYAEMQGYAGIPTSDPLPGEPTPVAEPVTSPWQPPVAPASSAWSTEPAVVSDPVASAGPMSLGEPFGANAPLPVVGQQREERVAMPQTLFNPIEPMTATPETPSAVSAQVGVAEPTGGTDVSWNPSWGAGDAGEDLGAEARWDVREDVTVDVPGSEPLEDGATSENTAESPGWDVRTDARGDVSSDLGSGAHWEIPEVVSAEASFGLRSEDGEIPGGAAWAVSAGDEGETVVEDARIEPLEDVGANTGSDAGADAAGSAGGLSRREAREALRTQGPRADAGSGEGGGVRGGSGSGGDAGGGWEALTGAGPDSTLDPLARVLAEQSRAASASSWADPRTDALADPLTDPLTDPLSDPLTGPVGGPADPTGPTGASSDLISPPPYPEPAPGPDELRGTPEAAGSSAAPAGPRQYPSRAELRRRRQALEALETESAVQAGAQAAAQVAAAQSAGREAPAPAEPAQPVSPRSGSGRGTGEPDITEDWAAAARAEDRNILGQNEDRNSADRFEEYWVAGERAGSVPSHPTSGAGVRRPDSPLDDPDLRSAPAPAIPAQAEAPEDEPGFEEPAPAEPAETAETAETAAPPRHAASGPIPMLSASRSSLAGPNDGSRQRATQVRSMLSGLRSGAEKGRREATENTEGDAGVPRPRPSGRPEQ